MCITTLLQMNTHKISACEGVHHNAVKNEFLKFVN